MAFWNPLNKWLQSIKDIISEAKSVLSDLYNIKSYFEKNEFAFITSNFQTLYSTLSGWITSPWAINLSTIEDDLKRISRAVKTEVKFVKNFMDNINAVQSNLHKNFTSAIVSITQLFGSFSPSSTSASTFGSTLARYKDEFATQQTLAVNLQQASGQGKLVDVLNWLGSTIGGISERGRILVASYNNSAKLSSEASEAVALAAGLYESGVVNIAGYVNQVSLLRDMYVYSINPPDDGHGQRTFIATALQPDIDGVHSIFYSMTKIVSVPKFPSTAIANKLTYSTSSGLGWSLKNSLSETSVKEKNSKYGFENTSALRISFNTSMPLTGATASNSFNLSFVQNLAAFNKIKYSKNPSTSFEFTGGLQSNTTMSIPLSTSGPSAVVNQQGHVIVTETLGAYAQLSIGNTFKLSSYQAAFGAAAVAVGGWLVENGVSLVNTLGAGLSSIHLGSIKPQIDGVAARMNKTNAWQQASALASVAGASIAGILKSAENKAAVELGASVSFTIKTDLTEALQDGLGASAAGGFLASVFGTSAVLGNTGAILSMFSANGKNPFAAEAAAYATIGAEVGSFGTDLAWVLTNHALGDNSTISFGLGTSAAISLQQETSTLFTGKFKEQEQVSLTYSDAIWTNGHLA